jgi:uncharacterized membrane protein YozB (DUF420 family)
MTVSDLPACNATFNAISTVFISLGWWFIRRGFLAAAYRLHDCGAHLFLFLSRRLPRLPRQAGEKSSGYSGLIAWLYFPMLISHILLAFVTAAPRNS